MEKLKPITAGCLVMVIGGAIERNIGRTGTAVKYVKKGDFITVPGNSQTYIYNDDNPGWLVEGCFYALFSIGALIPFSRESTAAVFAPENLMRIDGHKDAELSIMNAEGQMIPINIDWGTGS